MRPLFLAAYIIDRCNELGIEVNNLKLQKLMFYVYSRYARHYKEFMFSEPFLKWQYGPVIRSVYDQYKVHGAFSIKNEDVLREIIEIRENEGGVLAVKVTQYNPYEIPLTVKDFVEKVLDEKGDKDPFELVKETKSFSSWKNYEKSIMAGVQNLTYSLQDILAD